MPQCGAAYLPHAGGAAGPREADAGGVSASRRPSLACERPPAGNSLLADQARRVFMCGCAAGSKQPTRNRRPAMPISLQRLALQSLARASARCCRTHPARNCCHAVDQQSAGALQPRQGVRAPLRNHRVSQPPPRRGPAVRRGPRAFKNLGPKTSRARPRAAARPPNH